MGKIKKILENELIGGTQSTDVYPVTSIKAVYDENNERLDNILNRRGVVNISTNYNSEHTAEVLTLAQALSKVPSTDRVLGFQGKYLASDGWHTIIYIGDSLTSWSDTTKWIDLADKIFNSISNNATFAGIATPTTNPGTPDGPVFYLATEAGTYSNFNGISVADGEAVILEWKGSWTKKTTGFATQQQIVRLDEKLNDKTNEINVAKEEALQAIAENEQSAITNFNSQRVTPEMLSEGTKQLIEASGGGTITNLADDEDLTSVDNGTGSKVLKFADRTYNADNFSGQGYVILRKNLQSVKFKIANISINIVGNKAGNISFKIMGKVFNIPFDPASETTIDLIAKKIADTLTNNVPDFNISQSENTVTLTHTVICKTPDVVFIPNDTGVEATVLMTEKEEIRNVLTSDMVSKANTIYEVRYDFDIISTISAQRNIKYIGNGGSINFNRNTMYTTSGNVIIENLKLINVGNYYTSSGLVRFTSKNCVFVNKGYLQNQALNIIKLDVMDYMQGVSTNGINGQYCVNLNEILDRIYSNFPTIDTYYIELVFPDKETGYFYVERPIIIKQGFKYDFKELTIYSTQDYSYDHIVEYESSTMHDNIVSGTLKNARFDITNTKKNLKTVFDLTKFSGVLENVKINLGKNTAFAYLQPIGTASSSYSDMKRIIRCSVTASYNEEIGLTPRTLFCFGDGCIIEQSNLAGVLIFGGRGYTIIGCLNDRYYLMNTFVNFEGCYWEIGQFRILNSSVNFMGCQLHFDNDLTYTSRHFKGSLFSIDTEEAKNDIFFALYRGLGLSQKGFVINPYSKIGFYNNSYFELVYWYVSNKYSGKIISIGKNTIIKNVDELAFQERLNIGNQNALINKIILNDTDFQYDLQRKSIDFTKSVFNISAFNPSNLPLKTNFSWSVDVNIKVDFYYVISERKQIYKKIGTVTGTTEIGKPVCKTTLSSNFVANEDRFIFAVTIGEDKYIVKRHIQENNLVSTFYKDKWDKDTYKNVNLKTTLRFAEIEPGKYKCDEVECINDTELYDTLINNNFNTCSKCIVDEKGINIYTDTLPSFGEWEFGDRCTIGTITYMYDGNKWNAISSIKGLTSERPSLQSTDEGFEYYDSTLKKKILWNGVAWVNIDGTELS